MFVNTTAVAYTKIVRLQPIFCLYAIAVVFTSVMRLRVPEQRASAQRKQHSIGNLREGPGRDSTGNLMTLVNATVIA